jgi:glycosyltransferase involved in cell wall biosynthesis
MAAVGPKLAAAYSRAPRLLELVVSFVDEDDIVSPDIVRERAYTGEIRLLSVSRLDPEKNPLLLADVLAALTAAGYNVRLVVCGEGPLIEPLLDRLRNLGVADRADLLGYVPVENGLRDVYRSSHVFLHTSWTEGVPQVLLEAFAARLPTVATDVGSVAAIANDSAVVVQPGDPEAAAAAVERIITDAQFRQRLSHAGGERVRLYTRDMQLRRLADWLQEVASDQRGRAAAPARVHDR